MKFNSLLDMQLFLAEINENKLVWEVDNTFIPTNEMIDTFIKKRKKLTTTLKSFRKSQQGKQQWRDSRYKMLKAIRQFHKSTKGKRFHRNMSRFMINRIGSQTIEKLAIHEKSEILKSLSSAKTHLVIELEYYHPIQEQIELEDFIFDSFDTFNSIDKKILNDVVLNEIEENLLINIIEVSALIKSFAQKSNKPESEIEKKWNSIKAGLIKAGKSESDKNFFSLLVGILKKQVL